MTLTNPAGGILTSRLDRGCRQAMVNSSMVAGKGVEPSNQGL